MNTRIKTSQKPDPLHNFHRLENLPFGPLDIHLEHEITAIAMPVELKYRPHR